MPIGMRVRDLTCLEETTSGRNSRVRARRRNWGSDEVALFAAVHDAASGRLLTVYRHHRGEVDSGDVLTIEQSALAPADSTDSIIVTLVGYEIDGRGALGTLVKDKYDAWVDAVSDADWGLSVENDRVDAAVGVLLVPPFAKRVLHDDVILLDRFEVAVPMFTAPAAPAEQRYAPSDTPEGLSITAAWDQVGPRGAGGGVTRMETTRSCRARGEDSTYVVRLEFMIGT